MRQAADGEYRQVLLLQSCETGAGARANPLWTADDRAWATRLAAGRTDCLDAG